MMCQPASGEDGSLSSVDNSSPQGVPATGEMRSKRERVAVAIVQEGDRVLVGRRGEGRPWAGYLEFPGGRLEAGESWEQAVVREVLEETGLSVVVTSLFDELFVQYPYADLEIRFYLAQPALPSSREPRPPFFWMDARALRAEDFPPANAGMIARLRARLGGENTHPAVGE